MSSSLVISISSIAQSSQGLSANRKRMAATTKAAEEETEYSPRLQKRTLKGHQKPVLCLAHSSERLAYHSNEGNEHTE